MPKKKPIVALIYDFDGTLSPLNMQEYDFLKAIGIKNKAAFWKENNELIKEHEASNILCYMKLMIDKARAAKVSIKREQFVNFGKSIELYKGVEEWFDLIKRDGAHGFFYVLVDFIVFCNRRNSFVDHKEKLGLCCKIYGNGRPYRNTILIHK